MSIDRNETPQIRFKGYTKGWEDYKLGEVLDSIYNGQTPSRKKVNYWNGDINWLSSGELNRGVVHETLEKITEKGQKDANLKIVPKNTFVMAITGLEAAGTRGNCAILGIDTALNQSCTALFPKKDILVTPFLFQWYRKVGEKYGIQYTQGTKQQSYNSELIKILPITLPNVNEQIVIANFLVKIDKIIFLHKRKYDLLCQTKETYLQKIFPKDKKILPELRFKNFSNNWEKTELDNLVTQVIREVPKPDQPYERLSIKSHAKGTFHKKVNDPKSVAMDKLFVVKENDLILNITFAWEHAIAVANKSDEGLLVSHRFPTYRADNKSDLNFLYYLVTQENFRKKLEFISPGGAGRNRVLNKKDFLKLKVTIPSSIDEQKKIGSFFKKLDDIISTCKCELDQLKTMKKALTKSMFA